MLRKTEGRRRSGGTQDEMVGWHHQLNGQEFEQFRKMVKDREESQRVGHSLVTEQQPQV